jgi:hypothetical protein
MKILEIKKDGNIYLVKRKPNLLQKIFGFKEKTEKYKDTGKVFTYLPHISVYIKQNGELLDPLNKITTVLDNFKRSF